jgi:hypothetical protein
MHGEIKRRKDKMEEMSKAMERTREKEKVIFGKLMERLMGGTPKDDSMK